MKKIICLFFTLCMSASVFAQTKIEALAALVMDIEITKKSLPKTFGFCTLYNLDIIGNDYIVNLVIDENQVKFDDYFNNVDEAKLFSLIAGQNQAYGNLFIKSELNLRTIVSGNISKRTKEIYLSADKIKQSKEIDYSIMDYLRDMVVAVKKTLPDEMGGGLFMTDIQLEGKYLCFYIKTDESLLTIPLLKRIKEEGDEMEKGILEDLRETDDVSTLLLIKLLKQSSMGVKHTYWSDRSNDTVTFVISPNIIKSLNIKEKY